MICRCVPLLVLVAMLMLFSVAKHSLWPEAGAGWWIEAAADDGYSELSLCKKDSPVRASLASSRFVQSQPQHAQGSVPFS